MYVMYFILNLNKIESEMTPGSENMTHITVLLQHTTHQEIAQHKLKGAILGDIQKAHLCVLLQHTTFYSVQTLSRDLK